MTTTFQTGQTYSARMICDHNCIVSITVAKRTAKFLTTTEGKRLGISVYEGVEQVYPDGHYSMATVIGADDTKTLLTDWELAAQRKADATPFDNAWIISTIRAQETVDTTSPATVLRRLERAESDYVQYVSGCQRATLKTTHGIHGVPCLTAIVE